MLLTALLAASHAIVAPPTDLVRLIACDIDGTLLTPAHTVTARTERTVLRAMSEVAFVPCTGRGRLGAYQALGSLGRRLAEAQPPGVYLNGLITYLEGGKLLSAIALERDVGAEVAAFAAEHGITLVGFSGDRSLCESRSPWTSWLAAAHDPDPEEVGPWRSILMEHRVNKLMLLGEKERMAELRPLLAARLGADGASLVCSGPPEMLEVRVGLYKIFVCF